ncbi:hypothetical protein [Nocardia sp. NPDC050435]|uniref:hypothetical protein n=1 Tax=Nocardia sp. NPDC050435 TaxID=3155040 RepID=UPI0033DF3D41
MDHFDRLLLVWLLELRPPNDAELEAILADGVRWAPLRELVDAAAAHGLLDSRGLSWRDPRSM